MKKKQLNLGDLKVNSFVTNQQVNELKGGAAHVQCITSPINGC